MKEEWKLPKFWSIVEIKDVSEINPGIPNKEDLLDDMEVQFLPMKLVEECTGKIHLNEIRKFGEVKKGYTSFINGDIIFAKVTPCMENGKIAIVDNLKNKIGFGSTEFHVIRASEKIKNKFIFYFVIQDKFRKDAENEMTGVVGLRRVPKQFIEKYLIPLPQSIEQQAIVAKIEELLSDLENGKQQLQIALQQLKIYRQSLLKWAFEGKLTNKNVKEGELPKDWRWVKNKEILKYVTSGSRDWKKYYSTKGSRFVRTQDINSNKLSSEKSAFVDLPEKVEGKRSLIEEGDILMTITGANVGKVAVIDFPIKDAYVSQSVALLKYKDIRYAKFYWYFFQAQGFGKSFIDKLVYGVGRPVLSLDNMKEVEVLICPFDEQTQIVKELDNSFILCDKIEETISHSLQQAETLKQSILKKAFEGKLV